MTQYRIASAAALTLAALALTACGTVKETVRGPKMSSMSYPSALVPMQQQIQPPPALSAGRPERRRGLSPRRSRPGR